MIKAGELERRLVALARTVDQFLGDQVAARLRNGVPAALSEPALYSLLAPGKRIRPILVLCCAGYSDVERKIPEAALLAAAALESIHTYSLIHDDLPAMDDDDLRRGIATCHRQYSEWQAILAGDALNTFAFELLASAFEDQPQEGMRAVRALASAAGVAGMCAGQALDLSLERVQGAAPLGVETIEDIHLKKTAALIGASCEIGALLGGAPAEPYRAFGVRLGLLFQMVDDLLDFGGDADKVGKRVGKDAARGKQTYPALIGYEQAIEQADAALEHLQIAAGGLPWPGEPTQSPTRFLAALAVYIRHRDR